MPAKALSFFYKDVFYRNRILGISRAESFANPRVSARETTFECPEKKCSALFSRYFSTAFRLRFPTKNQLLRGGTG